MGPDPFIENIFERVSIIADKESAGSFTVDYRLNDGDTYSGQYTVDLSTGPGIVRSNHRLPAGQLGSTLDLTIDSSGTDPLEILGMKLYLRPSQWRDMLK